MLWPCGAQDCEYVVLRGLGDAIQMDKGLDPTTQREDSAR